MRCQHPEPRPSGHNMLACGSGSSCTASGRTPNFILRSLLKASPHLAVVRAIIQRSGQFVYTEQIHRRLVQRQENEEHEQHLYLFSSLSDAGIGTWANSAEDCLLLTKLRIRRG